MQARGRRSFRLRWLRHQGDDASGRMTGEGSSEIIGSDRAGEGLGGGLDGGNGV